MAKSVDEKAGANSEATSVPQAQRKIPGNLPYLTSFGTLKKALDGSQEATRPEKFNADFLENVLKLTGGGARATVPILKKMGFLTSDSSPTDLYARFRTESGQSAAAQQGLRNAFPEIFKRSEWAHSVDDNKLKDIVMEITGLPGGDPVVKAIVGTFKTIRSFITATDRDEGLQTSNLEDAESTVVASSTNGLSGGDIRLAYNINIVLPETSDLKVLNAIFRSIRENLMK